MTELEKRLQSPGKEYRCDVRWWLAEALHTDETLKKEVQTLSADGFGAAEFLAMDELGTDSSRYGWGSEEWVHDTETILRETTEHGLGASMTSGTNWSNANLPSTVHMPDDQSASKELDFTEEVLGAGESRSGSLQKTVIRKENVFEQQLVAVVAAKKAGEAGNCILLENPVVLTEVVKDGALDWTAPQDGEYRLLTFWTHGTGQTASPSVSVSYTVNYMDRFGVDKLIAYWDAEVLTPTLRSYIKKNGRIQMYMDSLELSVSGKGGVLWGYTLLAEFKARRGYDFTPYIPFILRRVKGMVMGPIDYYYTMADTVALCKIRNDFYQTMTDLYVDNMLKPLQEWLHGEGMTLRAEISYGLPFEISQPGKYVDGIETESLEFASQIDSYRGLAGVAHLYDKVFSSETGAVMMNYRLGLDFFTQIIFTQFAAGVTKTVLHGYASICGSPEDTHWPGHDGMFPTIAERFNERQPYYRFIRDWTAMIGRFQYLLRSGKPRRDIAILRLDYNFWQSMFLGVMSGQNEETFYANDLMRANTGIYWKDTGLQSAGYSYDYFAPQLLEDTDVHIGEGQIQPDGPGYQAVILYQEELPLSTAKALLRHAQNGLPVLFVNGITETVQLNTDCHHTKAASHTPFQDGKDEELLSVVTQIKTLPNAREIDGPSAALKALRELGVGPRAGFMQPNQKIFTLLREEKNWRYLYAYHFMYTDTEAFTATVQLPGEGTPYAVDCWSGKVRPIGLFKTEDGFTQVPITLKPGEATMLALDTNTIPSLHAIQAEGGDVAIENGSLVFCSGENGKYTITLSDGSSRTVDVKGREAITLPVWDLTLESWSQGDKKEIIEDRGLGYVSKEVYYETAKETIAAGRTELKPWKDIPAVGEKISGLGFYKTAFTLPANWDDTDGAWLALPGTSGNAAAVFVNEKKVVAYNVNRQGADITALLHAGENTIRVEVASTLANHLRTTDFFERAMALTLKLTEQAIGEETPMDTAGGGDEMATFFNATPSAQPYGLVGTAQVKLYKKVALQ